jgi:N-methylhydantoinase A
LSAGTPVILSPPRIDGKNQGLEGREFIGMADDHNKGRPNAPWRIGVDVGGTFTDLVLRGADGALTVTKVPSVPDDPSLGVLQAVEQTAAGFGIDIGELLRECALFVHGSTIGTNTILERRGARVGMLTTEGFRDSLEIRRGIRENQWDHRAPFPEVLVPRYLRLPVRGRIDRDGQELAPLEGDDVIEAVRAFAEEGVDSVAICLLGSYLNPAHEQAAAELVRANGNGAWLSISSDITPVMGEYERGSTTVVNAYIGPKVVSYVQELQRRLQDLGLPHPVLLVQSNGGAISVDQIAERPVNLVLSGPAAGVGALDLYRAHAQSDDLISLEIGGTSCDVTLMNGGAVAVSDELIIDGYHLATPSVDIHTVGAGGGTVAWVDAGGLLHVGPKGSGADPGPACYGLGGEQPTVTDAHMVLGRLRPGPYAGGSVTLDGELARRAIEDRVAGPLGIDAAEAAAGILRLLEQNLLQAVERISIERGHDPRRFTLVAAGGAGPMHGAAIGRALGCGRVYIPRQAGVFCALGMLHADVRQDYLRVYFADLEGADGDAVEDNFGGLEARARAALEAEGFSGDDARTERQLDLRYRSQLWSLRVDLDDGWKPARIREAFEAEHGRQFGHIQPEGTIEITALRVVGRGLLEWAEPAARAAAAAPPEPIDTRPVYVSAAHGWQQTPVYTGTDLRPGHNLTGPLLVEEQTTTVFAGPGDRVEVDAADNIVIHLAAGEI